MSDRVSKARQIEVPANVKIFLPALGALLILGIFASIMSENFLTQRNIINVLNQAVTTGIMGVGLTFILACGKFDLSSAATVCLTGMISSDLCANYGVHWGVAILIAILMGVCVGLFNGFLVSYLGLIPFIATMGTMNMLKGMALMYSKSLTIFGMPDSYTMWGSSRIFDFLPSGIVISLILYGIGYVLLSRSVFGHRIFAIGGNNEAAKLAGINVKRTILYAYVLAGVCYAIAGVVLTGRVGAAYPSAAEGTELEVIAGIVIGGTAMSGGRGSHIGTWLGILLVALINNAINLLGISAYATKLVQGSVILIAVIAEVLRSKAQEKRL